MKMQEIKRWIAAALCIVGILIMIGSAGALEQDMISFTRGFIQMFGGFALFAGAAAYNAF